MKIDLDRLCRHINYHFTNQSLLKQALTHCSAGSANYERFEFLGDSILSFVIASELFIRFPDLSEGQLSPLRAYLVKGDTLAEIAQEISLGDYLYLGQGELKSGGFRRASILADSLEAIFAAIYLDSTLDKAKTVIMHLYQTRIDDPDLPFSLKDAKTLLQEYLQAKKLSLPEYTLLKVEGDEHHQHFYVQCTIKELDQMALGQGKSRRKAEQLAAKNLLEKIQ